MQRWLLLFVSTLSLSGTLSLQGPVFLQEPPSKVLFSNSTGVVLSCSGHGNPIPRLRWVDASDNEVSNISGLRKVIENGSLYLPPFPSGMFRPEIHATAYHCMYSNSAGSILSRATRVQAVIVADYQVEVPDAHTLSGNVAVLRCQVTDSVQDVVRVAGWTRDEGIMHRLTINSGGRYMTAGRWALHVSDVSEEDTNSLFYCQTIHSLTGERRVSSAGRIIITESNNNVPPSIADSVQIVTGMSGSGTELTCSAQGNPPPSIRWFREIGGRLEDLVHVPSSSVLSLPMLQMQDAGRYACIARNIMGEDRRDVVLRVFTELNVSARPQQQIVDAGSIASFNCSVTGGRCSETSAAWRKNSRPLVQDGRISVSSKGSHLTIRSVRRGDEGMYQCFVSCSEEAAQATAELILGALAPELQSTFLERTIEPGPPVSLRCAVTGNPPPRVTWLLDGGELRPQGYALGSYLDQNSAVVSHLNLTSVRVQHGGVYTCLARNLLGTAQHSAALNVYGQPSPRPPLNLTVVAATDVMLRCPAAGYPLSVSWSRGKSGLPPGPHHVLLHNGTLLIRQVDGSRDSGAYSCTATSDLGMSAQGHIYLQVMKPPKIAPFSFPTDLEQGMRVQVACSVISGDLPISITWRKDGGPLPQDQAVQEQQMEFVSNLMFSNLAARHTGEYTCIASNAAAVANGTASLTVRVAPSWDVEPQDTAVLLHDASAISCKARGYPIPKVSWMKPTGEVVSEMDPSLRIMANGTLLLRSVTREKEGQYSCIASNGIGRDLTKTIFLRVNVPARFRNKMQTQSAMSGEMVMLSCVVEGDSPLRITWDARHRLLSPLYPQVRERHVPSGLISELHLENVSRRDDGTFRCRGSNEFGHDETVIRLMIKETPPIPNSPQITEVRSRTVGVSWTLDQGSNALIQYRTANGIAWSNLTMPVDMTSARVTMLSPGTTYLVRLIAVNEVGASQPSQNVKATTLQEAPDRAPADVTAETGGSDSIVVRWTPMDSQSSSPILGYMVAYAPEGTVPDEFSHRRLGGSHRSLVVLSRLRTFTRYSLSVAVFNHIGLGPFSAAVLASTLQGVPDKAPEDVRCSSMTPQSLRVRWSPPSSSHHRGIVEGYKVLYSTRGAPTAIKGTTNLETTLHGLSKATNYSVNVLAFTAAGDGIRSLTAHCLTDEDIPGPPHQVKALPMTSDSIVVAWSVPLESNGNILKYNVYMHPLRTGAQVHVDTVLTDGDLYFVARRLQETTRYEFWVSASTSVGEGRVSIKLTQTPLSKAAARIAGWSKSVMAGVGERLTLGCKMVGLPDPSRLWRSPGGVVISTSFSKAHRVLPDGSLLFAPLRVRDAGNYTCQVENVFGRDEIVYHVTVLTPPGPPVAIATPSGPHTVLLEWESPSDFNHLPIYGYNVAWRKQGGDWKETEVLEGTSYLIRQLECGPLYQIAVSAFNAVGRGRASNVIITNTSSSVLIAPTTEEFIISNTTSSVLLLEDWPGGGCPIQHFGVDITRRGGSWRVVTKAAAPQGELEIPGLLPGTWYQLRVTATTEADTLQYTFTFATRTLDGRLPPVEMSQDSEEEMASVYNAAILIIPVLSGALCTLAAVVCICVFVRRCRQPTKLPEPNYESRGSCDKFEGQLGELPPPPECKAHSVIRDRKSSVVSGHDYEICPYATFNLADQQHNPSRDYKMQLRSFNQEECFQGAPHEDVELVRVHSSKSPPDGLSLEVSCISSQQTLPVRTCNRNRVRRATESKDIRPWSCPAKKYDSPSDSSERSTTPCQSPAPLQQHLSWKKTRKVPSERFYRPTTTTS